MRAPAELLRESVTGVATTSSDVQDLGHALDASRHCGRTVPEPEALQRAVQLWSAATKWHQNRPRLSPVRRSRYERTVAAVRASLARQAFAAAWAEGRAMTLEQAIAYALEETNPE